MTLFIALAVFLTFISLIAVLIPDSDTSDAGYDDYSKPTETALRGYDSLSYEELLHTPEWRERREEVLKAHGYACDWCGGHTNLQVHHRYYLKYPDYTFLYPWNYDDSCLMCLCEDCHRKYHATHKVKSYFVKYTYPNPIKRYKQ